MDAAWFHAFMEHSPVTAFIKDADGRLLYINQRFIEAFSFSDRDWFGKKDFELWPDETAKVLRANDLAILESGVPTSVEETVTHEDGEHHWVTVKFRFQDREGRSYLAGMGIDRTEQHQLESIVAQTSRMESNGKLAGGVAHDFNNLLTIVLCNCELARAPADEQGLAESLDAIQEAASLGSRLTQQLLGFAREQVRQPTVFDVSEQIDALLPMLRRLIPENVEVHVARSKEPLFIQFDPTQFEQALINLMVNACDAMPDGGELRIGASPTEAPVDAPAGDYVAVRVADNGAGIPEDVLPKVFDPFFTTKPRGHGTGLGLAMVDGIARQNDATMSVESTFGEGATFTLTTQRVTPTTETAKPAEQECVARTNGVETLLLVEDDDQVRRASSRILREQGYEVLVADSDHAAVEIASQPDTQIALLVSDIVMPGIGGVSLSEQITSLQPGLRTLFVSDYADNQLKQRGLHRDTEHLLRKPFRPHELAGAVRTILDDRAG